MTKFLRCAVPTVPFRLPLPRPEPPMPEALAIVAVFAIALIIYVAMWMQTRDPALHKPHEEFARLQHQVTWLEERLAKARREKWGTEMIASIEAERDATAGRLAKAGVARGADGAEAVKG